jgi:hypothetical protein
MCGERERDRERESERGERFGGEIGIRRLKRKLDCIYRKENSEGNNI